MICGVHTILVQTNNMDRSVAFYRDVLGMEPGYVSDYWSSFKLGEARLGIHPNLGFGTPIAGQGTVACLTTEDIIAVKANLIESGTTITQDFHDTPSGVILTFADPDNNALQVIQPGSRVSELAPGLT